MHSLEFLHKTVLVTGASRGLGLHTAQAFWNRGANLFLIARSSEALQDVSARFQTAAQQEQRVETLAVDVSRPEAPERIVEAARRFAVHLDVLVNNAAIIGPIGAFEENDWAGWQHAIQVNLLAPIALCHAAIPWMKARGGAIVNVSGGGATGPRPYFSAYATAKAGLVRFSETLAAELKSHRIRVNCIAPGAMNTAMLDAVLSAGSEIAGQQEYRKALEQSQNGGTAPETPAELITYLASDSAANVTGKLISAVWDPWRDLAKRAAELDQSDIYTLRRIVPADRGLKWA